MKAIGSAATDVGRKRDNNEDSFLIDAELGLFVVCDGMGGHEAGEVASHNAARFVAEYLREHRDELDPEVAPSVQQVAEVAEDAVEDAAEELAEMSEASDRLHEMGTTLSMLLIRDDVGVVAHVGDSRIYIKRGNCVRLMTTDHTMANELAEQGVLSIEEAKDSSLGNVLTRSLGREVVSEVDTRAVMLRDGDRFLICSDGLSNYFEQDQDVTDLLRDVALDIAAQRCVDFANAKGGTDNITALVVDVIES